MIALLLFTFWVLLAFTVALAGFCAIALMLAPRLPVDSRPGGADA